MAYVQVGEGNQWMLITDEIVSYEEKLPQTFLSDAFQSWLIGLEELRDLSSHSLLGRGILVKEAC